jgi:hypothetical protein
MIGEISILLLTAIVFVLTVILGVLTAICILLYNMHQKIKTIEKTQDVIFAAATNSEEYFNSIIEGERINIRAN